MFTKWKLDEGLDFVRALRHVTLRVGYTVALAGSVLYNGESDKDIDVVVFPMSAQKTDQDALVAALEGFGMKRVCDKEWVTGKWREIGSDDTKHVEVWSYNDKRVDLLFLS